MLMSLSALLSAPGIVKSHVLLTPRTIAREASPLAIAQAQLRLFVGYACALVPPVQEPIDEAVCS